MQQNSPIMPSSSSSGGNQKTMAIASLVVGVLNLCAWLLPLCGFPLGVIGIVLGVLGMKAPQQKNLAIAGIVLSGLGLLLACGNAILGAAFNSSDLYQQILQGLGQ